MIKYFATSFGVALALVAATAPAAAADIDTTTGGLLFNIQPFGSLDTATYGQTFVAGGPSLSSFSLFLNGRVGGAGPLDFKGYLGTWDGTKLGSVIYTSGTQTVDDSALTEFAFSTGNLSLTPGDVYIAFISVSDLPVQSESLFFMPAANDDIVGSFVALNNGTSFGDLTTNTWDSFGGIDAYFKANFGVVPEPASWALMIGGFGLVGAAMRRRVAAGIRTA